MSPDFESTRYTLKTERIISRWFELFWYGGVVLITGVGAISLAAAGNPAAIIFLGVGVLMSGFMLVMARGFANPNKNYVQLESGQFRVVIFQPLFPQSAKIPYAAVEQVEEHDRHGWWPFGYWPYTPMRPFEKHTDITLRGGRFLPLGWGRTLPWAKVIHLEVDDPPRLAADLRERITASTLHEDRR